MQVYCLLPWHFFLVSFSVDRLSIMSRSLLQEGSCNALHARRQSLPGLITLHLFSSLSNLFSWISLTVYWTNTRDVHIFAVVIVLITPYLSHLLESYANKFREDSSPSGKSFVFIKNSSGPMSEPCRTPLVTSTYVLYFLSFRKFLINEVAPLLCLSGNNFLSY